MMHPKEKLYDQWIGRIPAIRWPEGWDVRAQPPFGGALIRYFIYVTETRHLSIYLDVDNSLGYGGDQYWELYPIADGDIFRCSLNEIPELLNAAREAYAEMETNT